MNVTKANLLRAGHQCGVTEEQCLAIWQALSDESVETPSFRGVHVAYYLGGLLVAGAMGWFVTQAFDLLSGGQLALVGLVYQLIAIVAAALVARRPEFRVLSGVCATVAVCITPLTVFGLEKAFGLWPNTTLLPYSDFHPLINGRWIYMEAATVVVGAVILRFFRFPFITAPMAYALWYMSMDASEIILHKTWDFHGRCLVSIAFGAAMLVVSFAVDRGSTKAYAFWGYLFGMLTLWGGLTLLGEGDQLHRFFYALLNAGFVIVSLLLNRKVFLVFGCMGIFAYLTELAHTVFQNSLLFPFALTVLGIGVIVAGVLIHKNATRLKARFESLGVRVR